MNPQLFAVELLVIGGNSKTGSSILRAARARGILCAATTKRQDAVAGEMCFLDLAAENAEPPPYRAAGKAPAVLLCAAKTSLAECADRPYETRSINVIGTCRIARILDLRGFRPVLLSTNLVFSGNNTRPDSRNDLPNPHSEYGKQKYEAEQTLLGLTGQSLIIRLSKVVDPLFLLFRGWIEMWREGKPVPAFADMFFSPITLEHATDSILFLLTRGFSGVWHVSSHDELSYADAAYALATLYGVPKNLIMPMNAPESIPEGHRPRHPALDSQPLAVLTGNPVPSAMDALRWFVLHNPL